MSTLQAFLDMQVQKIRQQLRKPIQTCTPKRPAKTSKKYAYVPKWAHGTISGYSHYACRCAACRECGAQYHRDYRLRHHEQITARERMRVR